jgi:hypothetical protein
MRNLNYGLVLNDITAGESVAPFNKDFEDYKKIAFLFLNHKGKYLFADDILKTYNKGMTLEKVLEQEKDRFLPGSNQKKGGKMQPTFYDLWSMEEVEKTDDFFDFFFATKLRQLSILEIGDFLSYHLEHSFKNKKQEFYKFLNLPLSQHQKLITPTIREAVNDWIKTNETASSGNSENPEKEEKVKGRPPRQTGDRLTALNLNQTALLIQLMQQTGVILKGDYLTYSQAGKAFNLLTGYSAHTIRQQLGTKGEIEGVKFEDYKELHETLLRMASLIEGKTRKK